MLHTKNSTRLFKEARRYMPGGVNSPVRACKAVGGTPLIISRGEGARLYDADGNAYIDYVCSWGPLILGHAHPEVIESIERAARCGTSFGATGELEIELARLICEAVPSIQKVRMVNSGTEAAMSAVRLARAWTGRDKILKFEGCYHGHADSFLIKAGSGLLTAGVPTSPGVPASVAEQTLVAQYNRLETVEAVFSRCGGDLAAVIVEPVAGNMGLVLPCPGFLEGLHRLTRTYGSLLIFDEVISGFRFTFGGYQNIAGIAPDLTILGKIIGGGLPVGAYGGRADIMERVSPEGDVYQAGTLSGNPLAMAAGITTLTVLQRQGVYQQLESRCTLLVDRIRDLFKKRGIACRVNHRGSLFTLFFTDTDVTDYAAVASCDTALFARFYRELLTEGVFIPPSQFEACFLSCAHSEDDVAKTAAAVEKALDRLAGC